MTAIPRGLAEVVGAAHLVTDPQILEGRSVDYTGRYRGRARALVRPGSAAEVAEVLALCRAAGAYVTIQGGRTSLVAGTVPEHDDILLSTERLCSISEIDTVERRIEVGAGVTAAAVSAAAAAAGLLFGVDLAARDIATVGGMASTNAGGLRTVRYGTMGEQIIGLQIALPDGSLLRRQARVRRDNTGYDLPALFVGAEGTLGVLTSLEVRLHPIPVHRVTAICGFAELGQLVDAGRLFRDVDAIAAVELIDGRALALARTYLGLDFPIAQDWLLLVELVGDHDQTEVLARCLSDVAVCGEPAIGVDVGAQRRMWRVRESLAEVVGLFGAPLKFDVSLPLDSISGFAAAAAALVNTLAPAALPLLFGHIGEGNLHLNVLGCGPEAEAMLYRPMMNLIGECGGNVSSEHGVGSRKRPYLGMSREASDIALMRTIKFALDPTGYLNAAVLFD